MPREILSQIIKERLILDLTIILSVYFLTILIIFKLNFQMLGLNIKFKKMIPSILILITYLTLGKQILPAMVYSLTYIILSATLIILLVRGEVSWIKAVWSSLLGYAISGIGVLTILSPLCSFNQNIFVFLMKTPSGIPIAAGCEGVFPIIAYFLLKTVGITLIPPIKRKVTLLDIGNLYIFAVPFGFLYNSSMQMLKNIGISPISDLIKGYIFQLFIAGSLPIIYYFVYTNTNKRHMDIVQKLESEKNDLTEKMHKVIDFKRELDPQIKEFIEESFIKYAEAWAARPVNNQDKPFTLNFANLALYGLKELDGKILGYLVLRKTNQEIAELLTFSEGHIKNSITEMNKKFGVKNRRDLGRIALDKHLVEFPKDQQ